MAISNIMNIGLSGVFAAQKAINVTSNNISNANTANYHKEVISLKSKNTDVTLNSPNSQNMGVEFVDNIRISKQYLESQMSGSISNSEYYKKLDELSASVNSGIGDKLKNLSTDVQNIQNAFSAASLSPKDNNLRQEILNNSAQYISDVKTIKDSFNQVGTQLNESIDGLINEANMDVKSLVEQYKNIPDNQIKTDANFLNSLYSLSQKVGLNVSDDYKTISLKDGTVLISNGQLNQEISNSNTNNINGSIGALIDFKNNEFGNAKSMLDSSINNYVNNINTKLNNGFDLNSNQGSNLFNISNSDVNSLSINITNTNNLALSSTQADLNGNNASDIATVTNSFSSIITNLNNNSVKNANYANIYEATYNQLNGEINNNIGVNLDEEATNLMKYQKMYQANAQVIKVADGMIGTILNIMG